MTDERDPKVTKRYAELGADEPSPHVDAAILAAARRAAETRPAPLVPPTGRRKWYFPLAAAAVIVLAVAVTVQVEREQPDPGVPVVEAPRKATVEEKKNVEQSKNEPSAVKPERAAPVEKPRSQPQPFSRQAPSATAKQESNVVAQQAPPAAPAAPPPSQAEDRTARDSVALSRAAPEAFSGPQPGTAAGTRADAGERREAANAAGGAAVRSQARPMAKVQSPEQELERIAELRKQGRDDEADKALAEFRKRYPDFRISEEMLKRVEKN